MTFTDLPRNWTDLPLTDPALAADVVDLYVTEGDRRSGVFSAILGDHEARFIASIQLDVPDYADNSPTDTCEDVLDPVLPALQLRPDGTLLLALGRPGPDIPLPIDLEWSQAAARLCRIAGIRLLAFYIAAPGRVYLPEPAHRPTAGRELAHTAGNEVDLTDGPVSS